MLSNFMLGLTFSICADLVATLVGAALLISVCADSVVGAALVCPEFGCASFLCFDI